MQRMNTYLLATVSAIALGNAVYAADMPVKAPVPPPAPVMTWAGLYIGISAGAIWNHWEYDDRDNLVLLAAGGFGNDQRNVIWSGTKAAAIVGGHIGYNLQSGNVVYGLEADWSWTNARSNLATTTPGGGNAITGSTRLDWLATVRGRLGLTFTPATLGYVTGGVAFADVSDTYGLVGFNPQVVKDSIRVGWVAGAGIEHMFARNWTARVEALYVDLGDSTATTFIFGANYRSRFEHNATIARGAISLKW
jgi:outer membrane immunogenic protein